MDRVIYFDYCALALLVVLLLTLVLRKMTRGHVGRQFVFLVGATVIACAADTWANALDMVGEGEIAQKYLANTIYYLFHIGSMAIFLTYIITLTDTWHIVKKRMSLMAMLILPMVFMCVVLVVNTITPVIFYLDEADIYTRGPHHYLSYVVAGIYVLYSVIYSIKYYRTLGTMRFCAIMSMYVLTLVSVLIQFYFPQVPVEMYCNALALLFLSMMVLRPEDNIDSESKLYKLKAYISNIRSTLDNQKRIEIIQVNVTNYKSLREMLGYEGMSDVMTRIAKMMFTIDQKWKLDSEIYNLGNGKIRLVVNEKKFGKAEGVAQEINELLKKDVTLKYGKIGVIANVCLARMPEDVNDLESLMAFGDDLTTYPYTGKVLYASEIFKKRYYDIMRDIDAIIEHALTEKKFEVYYQPIYSVKEKRFASAEALLRLKDEKYGFISPEIFIPASEKSGAIHRVGDYVLEEVCRFISSEIYSKLGLDYIEVNLSVAQCMSNELADKILDTLKRFNVSPSQINLEVTETAVEFSQSTLMDNLSRLTEAGIMLSLDDFGTGYSNMRRIALLPLSIVKLDRSFTNAEDTPNMHIVLEDTIRMIKNMQMKIVVEGIETEELVKMYSDLQCEYIQGYYYSKPIPKDDFTEFIMNS